MTPKTHEEEDRRLVALIAALEADIANPIALQLQIERDEARIAAMQAALQAAKDRQAKLPELLETAKSRLKAHRQSKPGTSNKLKRLLELTEMIRALKAEIGEDS